MAGGKKSFEAREKAALALANGETFAEAAAGSGCSERTLYTWMAHDAEFQKLVADIHTELLDRALSCLAAAQARAARRLTNLLSSENEQVGLKAAVAILAQFPEVSRLVGNKLYAAECKLDRQEAEEEEAAVTPPPGSNGLGAAWDHLRRKQP